MKSLKDIDIMVFECNTPKHLFHNEKKLITNYEKLYKKSLQNSNKYATLNMKDFAKEYEKEQKMPGSVRGNAPWIKKLYGEIESRPITATFGTQRKDKLLSDFAKEAESIYKLDAKNRELPTIKEYMQKKYNFTAPKTSEIKTSNEPLKEDGSVTKSLLNRRGVVGQNYGVHKSATEVPVETTFGIGYNKKPTSYGLFAENDNSGTAVNAKMSEELSYEKPSVTYTNYSAESGAVQHKANSENSTNFDYNTTLSYSQEYDSRVETLQKRLVELGYLNVPNGEWGYFGRKTQAAVNTYKEDNDLGNDGKYNGVVDKETWKSLGLICREQQDIDAGVEIVTVDDNQYYDITKPLVKQLTRIANNAEVLNGRSFVITVPWFLNQVYHGRPWDIKRQEPWEKTLGITYPGDYDIPVVLNGEILTPEQLGNITYGYIGAALGYNLPFLYTGSYIAANPKTDSDKENEKRDRIMVEKGYTWYYEDKMKK